MQQLPKHLIGAESSWSRGCLRYRLFMLVCSSIAAVCSLSIHIVAGVYVHIYCKELWLCILMESEAAFSTLVSAVTTQMNKFMWSLCVCVSRCIPKYRVCLSDSSDCLQYECVGRQLACDKNSVEPACDTDGLIHASLCQLQQAGKTLAYMGHCQVGLTGEKNHKLRHIEEVACTLKSAGRSARLHGTLWGSKREALHVKQKEPFNGYTAQNSFHELMFCTCTLCN